MSGTLSLQFIKVNGKIDEGKQILSQMELELSSVRKNTS